MVPKTLFLDPDIKRPFAVPSGVKFPQSRAESEYTKAVLCRGRIVKFEAKIMIHDTIFEGDASPIILIFMSQYLICFNSNINYMF